MGTFVTIVLILLLQTETPDYLISELQDGVYDVMGHDDEADPWDLPPFVAPAEPEQEPIVHETPKVPPLRIKIPKVERYIIRVIRFRR